MDPLEKARKWRVRNAVEAGGGGRDGGGADTHWETREVMDKGRREKRQEIIKLN